MAPLRVGIADLASVGTSRWVTAVVCAAVMSVACGSDQPSAIWQQVPAPVVVDQTDDITLVDGTLSDGTYWGTVEVRSGTPTVVFRVAKARFGAFCEAWAAEQGRDEGCLNDYAVEPFPAAPVALSDRATVSVAQPEAPGTNRSITPNLLSTLLTGNESTTPQGYEWVPFPFIVVVADGMVVDAQQWWVP